MRRLSYLLRVVLCALLAGCGGGAEAGAFVINSYAFTAPVGGKTLTVTWQLPTTDADNTSIGTITDQQVCYDTVTRQGTTTAYGTCVSVGSASALTYQLTGLTANTLYYVATKVIVSGVASNPGNEVSATTAP
jgi:hypothetical protein